MKGKGDKGEKLPEKRGRSEGKGEEEGKGLDCGTMGRGEGKDVVGEKGKGRGEVMDVVRGRRGEGGWAAGEAEEEGN